MSGNRCKSPYGRGKSVLDFYKDGKPQYYCYGVIDMANDEPIEECKKCPDYVYGNQHEIDIDELLLRETFGGKKWLRGASDVDAEPIRHGHWIYQDTWGNFVCSTCGGGAVRKYPYCMWCGAKMDEVTE